MKHIYKVALLFLFFLLLPGKVMAYVYPVITTSSLTSPLSPNNLRTIQKTSDGTLHTVIQLGTQTTDCSGTPTSGLVYFRSIDSGSTWSCVLQLSADTTNNYVPDLNIDNSDNLAVVYGVTANGGNAAYDIYYRFIENTGTGNWSVRDEQTVFDGNGTTAYSYGTAVLDSTGRAWVAARYFDGTNYQISIKYSDTNLETPAWSVSQSAIYTPMSNNTYNLPY